MTPEKANEQSLPDNIQELQELHRQLILSHNRLQEEHTALQVEHADQKKAEEQLTGERKLLRTLIDHLPDYIYVKDMASRLMLTNRMHEDLLEGPKENIIGKTMVDILGEKAAGKFLEDDRYVFSSGQPIINREENIYNIHGELRWMLTTKVPLKDENGQITSLVGISRDITDRKNAEEALKIKNEELKKLSACLINVREAERKQLANEVHEELGQLASAVKIDLDWLRLKAPSLDNAMLNRVAHAANTAELLLKNIRRIASLLRPGMLDELGLNSSLDWLSREFSTANHIPCVFEQLADDQDISNAVKIQLYRICEETLANVSLHANAACVNITIRKKNSALELSVTDDGIGFDTENKAEGIGLMVMRERANSINGTLVVNASLGSGTCISVIIPD